jgi:hypothetical protein
MLEGPNPNQSNEAPSTLVENKKTVSQPIFPCQFLGENLSVPFFQRLLQGLTEKFREPELNLPLLFSNALIDGLKEVPHLIIFLDIDGVCWVDNDDVPHEQYIELRDNVQLGNLLRSYYDPLLKQYYDFDHIREFLKTACFNPDHMQRIKQLCEEFDARIVVSSNWRVDRTVGHLQNLFDLWGLGEYVIGKTKDSLFFSNARANEIDQWLKDNKEKVSGFVIVDDQYESSFRSKFPNHFVQCHSHVAFDEKAYNEAKRILQAQKTLVEEEKVKSDEVLSLRPSV